MPARSGPVPDPDPGHAVQPLDSDDRLLLVQASGADLLPEQPVDVIDALRQRAVRGLLQRTAPGSRGSST